MRHPALAIDPAGDALLAYNTATRKVHLSLRGAIAIAHRDAGGDFSAPEIVDETSSSAPAVAIGRDAAGIVAWTHDRRVYAVSVGPDGTIGKVKRIASPDRVRSLVAAAGEDGAATLAWISHGAVGKGKTAGSRYEVRAVARAAGHAFGAVRTVASSTDFVRSLALATDEDARVTLAWSREHFGDDRSIGYRGITGAILATTGRAGSPFPAPRAIAAGGGLYRVSPSVAAADGRVVLAWGYAASLRTIGVQAAIGRPGAIGPVQSVTTKTLKRATFGPQPSTLGTLAPGRRGTVAYVEPTEASPPTPSFVLEAADGS